jgi:hypothetical protein
VEKISAKSSFTNLWSPSQITTPTVLSIKTPSTVPPLPFGDEIQKDVEHDKFGKYFIIFSMIYIINNINIGEKP